MIKKTTIFSIFQGGWPLASICRMVQGLSQACIIPSIHMFLGKWTPLEERGRLASIVYGGKVHVANSAWYFRRNANDTKYIFIIYCLIDS